MIILIPGALAALVVGALTKSTKAVGWVFGVITVALVWLVLIHLDQGGSTAANTCPVVIDGYCAQ